MRKNSDGILRNTFALQTLRISIKPDTHSDLKPAKDSKRKNANGSDGYLQV